MNTRATLVLFVVAAALGLFLFLERNVPVTETRPRAYVFKDLKTDDFKSIEFAVGDRAIVLEKRGAGNDASWEIVKPVKTRADKQVVSGLLSDLQWLGIHGFIPDAEAKAKGDAAYGLDKPAATLAFKAVDGAGRLTFGAASPVKDDDVFVRAAETAGGAPEEALGVYVVGKSLLDTLKKPPESFQDRTLFAYDSYKADKIELTLGGEEVVLVKKDNDWRIDKPEDMREKAEYSPVSTFLNDLKEIRWKEWVEEKPADLEKYGLKSPASRVRVTVSETKLAESLLVGASPKDQADRAYARKGDDGPVVLVETAALKKIPEKASVFRSKKPFALTVDALHAIELKVGGQECALEKAASGMDWNVVKPAGQKVDREQVNDFVNTLNAAEVVDFFERKMTDPKTYGFDAPAARLGLTTKAPVAGAPGEGAPKDAPKEDKLEPRAWVFGAQGTKVFMKREDQGQVVEVSPKLLARLQVGALNFRSRKIVETKPENIQAFTLERTVRGQEKPSAVECVREAGQWKLKSPAGAEADAQRVNDVRAELHAVRALTWVSAAGNAPAYGLDRPSIRVDFTWTETKEVKKEPKPGGDPKPEGDKKDEKKEEKKEDVETVTETFRRVLRIGAPTKAKDGYYAQIEGDPAVFTLSPPTFEHLDQDLVKKPE